MARTKTVSDKYVNRAFVDCLMSAANTLTFQQIRFGVGTFQQVALKIQRIEWFLTDASLREVVGAADGWQCAITARDDLSDLDPSNQAIYALVKSTGLAANVEQVPLPYVTDFSNIGGLLVPANPIFIAMNTGGAAAASRVRAIMYYNFVELTPQESLEVLQSIIPGNV